MTSPVVTAAAPELIAVLQAVQVFITNLGPDPTKIPITAGPALQVLLGTVGLQLPAAVNAEWNLVQTDVNAKLAAAITSLQKPTS
jgi:hypothetical protein